MDLSPSLRYLALFLVKVRWDTSFNQRSSYLRRSPHITALLIHQDRKKLHCVAPPCCVQLSKVRIRNSGWMKVQFVPNARWKFKTLVMMIGTTPLKLCLVHWLQNGRTPNFKLSPVITVGTWTLNCFLKARTFSNDFIGCPQWTNERNGYYLYLSQTKSRKACSSSDAFFEWAVFISIALLLMLAYCPPVLMDEKSVDSSYLILVLTGIVIV